MVKIMTYDGLNIGIVILDRFNGHRNLECTKINGAYSIYTPSFQIV